MFSVARNLETNMGGGNGDSVLKNHPDIMDKVITRITDIQHLSIPFFFGMVLNRANVSIGSNRGLHHEVKRYMPIFNKIAESEKYYGHSLPFHGTDAVDTQERYSFTSLRDGTLEINLVPHKICPGDCLYCPNKATQRKTVERESFYPIDRIIKEAASRIIRDEPIERILLTGYGDPALNMDLTALFDGLAEITSLPVTVKSCGTLLWRESVRHDLTKAGAVHINLDAADKKTYGVVNKFHLQIPFVRYLDGIIEFRRNFTGEFAVNVHLIEGINTDDAHLERLSMLLCRLKPFSVVVQTLPAPWSDGRGEYVNADSLHRFMLLLGPNAEIVPKEHHSPVWKGKPYGE